MAILKCKMCGGDLNLVEGASTAECEYCGSVQTVPKVDDEKKLTLFARANRLRAACDFDKASGVYEAIVADFPEEAEAYWGLVLCKYGIEYVDDPATGKKIPTCHRSGFDSVMKDENVELAQEYADVAARKIYREEAKQIEELRKGIIAVSANEAPYDIFICYKETDFDGKRTLDSVLAQDIYDALTDKGYRVFFSRISLEDKLGTEYEPYIFAALNSAKIMLVIGTDFEYFNAVWVKNEWSRFLKLMAQDKSKHLIPCYKGIDAYDMPEEFARLQAQDLDKMGAIQDIVRGVQKLLPKEQAVKETVVVQQAAANVAPLLERAYMFLEDGEWNRADDFCEQVLNVDPKNAKAYLGKLLAEMQVKNQESLTDCAQPFEGSNNYQNAVRFADDELKTALTAMGEICREKIETARKDGLLTKAKTLMTGKNISQYEKALEMLATIPGWKNADSQIAVCERKIKELKEKEAADQLAWERLQSDETAKRKKYFVLGGIACAVIIFVIVLAAVATPNRKYNDAMALMKAGNYEEAMAILETLGSYRDSQDRLQECVVTIGNKKDIAYNNAMLLLNVGKYAQAGMVFYALGDYKDASQQWKVAWDQAAIRETISTGYRITAGVTTDGTVVATGDDSYGGCRRVAGWDNIVSVGVCGADTVGLKEDGTVVRTGNSYGSGDIDHWKDIVAIRTRRGDLIGLKADGTVVAKVSNTYYEASDVEDWANIVAISAGDRNAAGVKADGTAVVIGRNDKGQCNVERWKSLVDISAGFLHTVGLKDDGTVVATGCNSHKECEVSNWKDIIAVYAGQCYTLGLKSDGTVVGTGLLPCPDESISSLRDIVAITAESSHIVALKADGTVVTADYNNEQSNRFGELDVNGWKDIKTPD